MSPAADVMGTAADVIASHNLHPQSRRVPTIKPPPSGRGAPWSASSVLRACLLTIPLSDRTISRSMKATRSERPKQGRPSEAAPYSPRATVRHARMKTEKGVYVVLPAGLPVRTARQVRGHHRREAAPREGRPGGHDETPSLP